MTPEEFARRLKALAEVNAALKTDAWKDMPRDEAIAFMRDVIEKSDELLEILAVTGGEGPENEALVQRTVLLVTTLKERGEGIVAGLGER